MITLGMATYGFRYNAAKDNYLVDEEVMPVVRRIFYMVGVEGRTMHDTKKVFEKEGLPSPTGQKRWSGTFIRNCVMERRVQAAHLRRTGCAVTAEVAACLDPDKRYGVWWFNRRRHWYKQIAEDGPAGKAYRKQKRSEWKPEKDWVAVPVPDSGIPRG